MPDPWMPSTHKGFVGMFTVYVALALVLAAVITAAVWGWRSLTAETAGRVGARVQILSADSRIQAYDLFFNECASVQGLEGQLDAQYNERAAASGSDLRRVNANIAGITGARAQAIAQYNADARKGYTIGQFRASDLPYQLDPAPYDYVKGIHTSCEAA